MSSRLLSTLAAVACLTLLCPADSQAISEDLQLPNLGTSSGTLFSPQQEYELGQAWLMSYRRQAPVVNDPLISDYLEHLVFNLATHSELEEVKIDVVVVDNPTMNAFAVPGGVMGIHNGILLSARTEDQLASVISHELAHLSQHHFARRVEQQQKAYLPTLAGMLAGLVLAATAGGDAGMAAITATQAAALESQLSYSRQNEQEADRLGMRTMVSAGMDPNAVAAMFEEMQRDSRLYSTRVPEFLLTHPVTQSRIADARNRAANYPPAEREVDIEYQLMQARVRLHFEKNLHQAVIRFRSELADPARNPQVARYGLALALLKQSKLDEAQKELDLLLEASPDRISFLVAQAEIMIARGDLEQAQALLKRQLAYNPENHPLTMTYFEALRRAGKAAEGEALLTRHIAGRPKDPELWYQLAEIRGLAGNIVGVHEARAEYFYLNGGIDAAIKQLGYALPLVKQDYPAQVRIEQRIRDLQQWKEKSQF